MHIVIVEFFAEGTNLRRIGGGFILTMSKLFLSFHG